MFNSVTVSVVLQLQRCHKQYAINSGVTLVLIVSGTATNIIANECFKRSLEGNLASGESSLII